MKIEIGSRSNRPGTVRIRFVERESREQLMLSVSETEFSAKPGSLCYLHQERNLFVGVGDRAKLDGPRFRQAAGTAAMHLKKIGVHNASLALADYPQFAGPAVEGVVLADYRFDTFKTKKSTPFVSLFVELPEGADARTRQAIQRGQIVAEATNYCRSIGNLPPNHLYPKTLAERASAMARKCGLKATVLTERELTARKFGGLLAVGQGSVQPPRLIVLEHRGGKKNEAPLVFVGKAITFDTGGISIKPAANMEEMVFDKCGGMAVLGAMQAVARLKPKRNIAGIIAAAENMPGGNAYRPGDIVTAYDGTQIEVINTDAEGRVVLGDALAYARKDLKAGALIDLATLTGACGIALGEYAAGMWTNNEAFGQTVLEASRRTGERMWQMPMYEEYEDQIRSEVAGIKNTGGRLGGACTGAAFLKAFVGETPWVHLDIAYMAARDRDQAHLARGATGYGVRTLVDLAEQKA